MQMLAQVPRAGATQKDMEATASSGKAKLLALVEARYDSFAEGAAERDQPSECDRSGESNEESGRRQPQFPSGGKHDSSGPLDHRPALNSASHLPPALPVPDADEDLPP
jgi:hypothetical protein